MLLIKVAGALVLVVLIVVFSWRVFAGAVRSESGGERRSKSNRDVRPTLPPSPYQPSRGFRIITGDEPAQPHHVELPRLEANKEFVFNDPLAAPIEHVSVPHLRHDEQWAIDRSMRRAPNPRVRRRRRLAWTVLVLAVGVVVVVALVFGHSIFAHPPAHHVGLPVL